MDELEIIADPNRRPLSRRATSAWLSMVTLEPVSVVFVFYTERRIIDRIHAVWGCIQTAESKYETD